MSRTTHVPNSKAMPEPTLTLLQRLFDWVVECEDGHEIDGKPSPCWAWQGYCDPDGYAEIKWRGKKLRASRVAYAAFNGPIDQYMDVDHECRNPACINPKHLKCVDPVTNRVVLRNARMREDVVPF